MRKTMTDDDQPTCGKGLAANAVLPEHLSALMNAMADLLDAHVLTLDLTDETTRAEYDAYTSLARQHSEIGARLASVAQEMAGYRDLPMGRHHMEAMAGQTEPFARLVGRKRELLTLLHDAVAEDQEMLDQMGT
jgi:hypothetical protein